MEKEKNKPAQQYLEKTFCLKTSISKNSGIQTKRMGSALLVKLCVCVFAKEVRKFKNKTEKNKNKSVKILQAAEANLSLNS